MLIFVFFVFVFCFFDFFVVLADVIATLRDKGFRPAFLLVGVIATLCLSLFFGIGAGPLCNLVGFIYPVFASLKALSRKSEDQEQWLTYWIVYAFFCLFEDITDIFSNSIPFYYLLKIVFLIWCFLPQFRGATVVFENLIKPIFDRYERSIDEAIATSFHTIKAVSKEALSGSDSKKE